MLEALSLKNKILFLTFSVIWTSIFVYWVYSGYLWDREHFMLSSQQYEGPEAYYP